MSPYVGTFVNPFHPNVEYEWWVDKNISSDQCQTFGKDLQFFENDCNLPTILEDSNKKILRKPLCQLGN